MTLIPAQSSTPAQSTSAAPSAPSYASAAGSKKAPINSQHGKNSSISGGRPPITPALPSVQGLNNAASGEHSRKNSVTIGNGPSYSGNMNANAIKFGNFSPVMSHNSPQHPSHSPAPPSPIPINNTVSGGRPPSIQPPAMTFGSLGNDDRTRQNVPSQPGFHGRRESSHSAAGSDMNQNHRGGYHGRGRGYNNGNNSFGGHHNSMGYPPNNFRGGSGPGGRGGMGYQPGSHNGHNQNRAPPMHVTNSPQPGRSPHLANSQMSTPNMPPASLAQPMVAQTSPHQTHGYNNYHQSPMGGMQPNYYPPPHQYSQMPHNVGGVPGYQYNAPYGGPPGGPPFNHNFNAPPFTPGQASPMARSASQHSEKLATASPAIVGSTPATPNFVRPKPVASAIRITTPQGDALDLKDVRDRNAAAAAAKAAATSTPATTTPSRTPAEIQEELRRKIAEATKGGSSKEPESKNSAHADAKIKAEVDAKPAQEAKAVDESKAKTETEKVAEKEQKDEKKEEAEKTAEPPKNDEPEEDEMERMIREMEEADRREAEREAAYKAQQEAKKAAEAQATAKNKLSAEEEDKKLREAEREMERLEEEKERRRAQTGPKPSFKELLAASRAGKEILEPPKVEESITDKMSKMSLEPKVPKIDAPAGSGGSLPRGDKNRKPAALTLTPLATKIEPAQPSAALQSLKSARFLTVMNQDLYPPGIMSPNPAINPAVAKKGGKTFQYDAGFLLQFRNVFTEQPSTEFQSQVKSLIGDDNRGGSARGQTPRAASSKGASNPIGAPIGGGFGTGRVVGNGLSRSSTNPMAQFGGRGTAFPGRNPSSNVPNSPRIGSGRGGPRNNSNRPKVDKQAANMPLTAGMEIKPIQVSETGWKPTSVLQKSAAVPQAGVPMDPAMVQRKVKAALNKMTPENFDRISEQILTIASQSKDENDGRTLRQVIQLTFEKATDEAHWASMYAKFCKRMLESTSMDIKDETIKDKAGNVVAGGALFRKYLLNRCQEEFERGWKRSEAKSTESGALKTDGAAALLSDEYYAEAAAKRRGLGLVKFIGELYKLGMLTDRIMHGCIQGLVDVGGVVPDEAEVESLSKLLTTVGGSLEQSRGSGPIMDVYFDRIKLMIENPELNSRMRFMLMDVVDLRKNGWKGKEQNKGPKTLEEVRQEAEAAAAQKAAEAAKMTRGGSGRPPIGHGDARHGYNNNNAGHGNSNHIGKDDMKRLRNHGNTTTNRNSHGGFTLGPGGSLSSRNNSSRNRPLGPGGNLGLGRGSEDSASSSRNGQNSVNAFNVLASLDAVPNSPPSAAVSPALPKATPDTGKGE